MSSGSGDSPIPSSSPNLAPSSRLTLASLPPHPASLSSLQRQASHSSNRSARIPSPRHPGAMLPPSIGSSTSDSRSGSLASTPRLLSRKSSVKEGEKSGFLGRNGSIKGKATARADEDGRGSGFSRASDNTEGWKSPMSESGSAEVIETPQLRMERDPETGRKMINQYVVLQELGSGTHGRVRLGKDVSADLEDGESEYYAIKIVDRNPKKRRLGGFKSKVEGGKMVNENEIRKEIAIFKKVHHPNVVRMKEIIDDPESSKLFMILEYCEGGEIKFKGEDGAILLTVDEARRAFRDTLLGLEYLHHQGIIHRDIKPGNLLVAGDLVKISDFGCSHYSEALRAAAQLDGDVYVDDIELAKTAGSPAFFAPEMCYSPLEQTLSPSTPAKELPALTLRPPSVASDAELALPPVNATRTNSASSVPRLERMSITNAIDVWALGITLYCLLYGKTPFDAPNEYMLMQTIPTAEYEIPPTMGKERMDKSTEEAREALDLLARLLEKDPAKRITLEEAKKHPFTLRGISDAPAWLASTDPHAQSYVTVSNDEVAAVVIKSSSFRDRFRKGIKTISNKLQIFGGGSRSRSRSIGESTPMGATPQARSRDASPVASPMPTGSLSRRFSILAHRDAPSPRRQMVQLASPPLPPLASEGLVRAASAQMAHSGSHRQPSASLVPAAVIPLADEPPRSPRQMMSSSSLDKLKSDISPSHSLRRRQSADIEMFGRERSSSNASSSGFGSKIVRLLSRNNSQRNKLRRRPPEGTSDAGDISPAEPFRQSLEARRSLDTFESSSSGLGPEPSWDSRLRQPPPLRRGSNLSEEYRPAEEVDWSESLSDDDYEEDQVPSGLPRSAPNGNWRSDGLGLEGLAIHTASAAPGLEPIPDSAPLDPSPAAPPVDHVRSPRGASISPYRSTFVAERARSPLGQPERPMHTDEEDEGLAISLSRRGRRPSVMSKRLE